MSSATATKRQVLSSFQINSYDHDHMHTQVFVAKKAGQKHSPHHHHKKEKKS